MAGMVRRSLEPGVEGHGAFREAAGNAGAAVRYRADRPYMRARLRRFPLRRLRLAQSLSEARCLPRKDAGAVFGENLAAAAGLIAGSCHESQAYVGDLTIHRIIEQETTFLPALDMLPGLTPEVLAANKPWMRDAGAIDADDVLILCFQSYVVKTPHHTILVDSCIGNDKPRPLRPKWNMKSDDTYMRGLATAGFAVGDIDFVMCTHLHVDHVGWNTRLENGRWVPTF